MTASNDNKNRVELKLVALRYYYVVLEVSRDID